MKVCSACRIEKGTSEFHKNIRTKDGFAYTCKPCANSARMESYRRAEKSSNPSHIGRKNRNRKNLLDYLQEHPCVDCGESDPIVLQFDHLDASKKSFNVSSAVCHGWGWKKIKEEIDKCDVVCANCHLRRTAKQFNWYKYNMGLSSSG